MKLSVAIITFNEEKNIERCLQSIQPVADEIVVVDSLSTDATEAICKKYNVRFISEKFRGHIQQKNYALELTSHDFVLSLDADEELSAELTKSILEVKSGGKADAYKFNRLNNYCGTFIYHGGWYPDTKIRLWNKKIGKWGGENPHDQVIMNVGSSVMKLHGDLKHYTYRTIGEHLLQMNKFSDIAAAEAFKKNKKTSLILHLVLNPFFTFLKAYFLKAGFLDGVPGFQVAISGAYYRYLKYAKLYQLHQKR
jgi:glycosyltransferase involved in cell wall biosynthesis